MQSHLCTRRRPGDMKISQSLNQVVKAKTYLDPEPLLKHLKRLEVALGRKNPFPMGRV